MNYRGYLALVFGLIALVAIPATVFIVTRGSLDPRAGASQTSDVVVFFSPDEVIGRRGQPVLMELQIDTGDKVVGSVDITVQYDPSEVRVSESVRGGPVFDAIQVSQTDRTITLSGEGAFIGNATIATLQITPREVGRADITISETSEIIDKRLATPLQFTPVSARIIAE